MRIRNAAVANAKEGVDLGGGLRVVYASEASHDTLIHLEHQHQHHQQQEINEYHHMKTGSPDGRRSNSVSPRSNIDGTEKPCLGISSNVVPKLLHAMALVSSESERERAQSQLQQLVGSVQKESERDSDSNVCSGKVAEPVTWEDMFDDDVSEELGTSFGGDFQRVGCGNIVRTIKASSSRLHSFQEVHTDSRSAVVRPTTSLHEALEAVRSRDANSLGGSFKETLEQCNHRAVHNRIFKKDTKSHEQITKQGERIRGSNWRAKMGVEGDGAGDGVGGGGDLVLGSVEAPLKRSKLKTRSVRPTTGPPKSPRNVVHKIAQSLDQELRDCSVQTTTSSLDVEISVSVDPKMFEAIFGKLSPMQTPAGSGVNVFSGPKTPSIFFSCSWADFAKTEAGRISQRQSVRVCQKSGQETWISNQIMVKTSAISLQPKPRHLRGNRPGNDVSISIIPSFLAHDLQEKDDVQLEKSRSRLVDGINAEDGQAVSSIRGRRGVEKEGELTSKAQEKVYGQDDVDGIRRIEGILVENGTSEKVTKSEQPRSKRSLCL